MLNLRSMHLWMLLQLRVLLKNKISSLSATGGTNYDRGLADAAAAINTARTGAKKIVIFLTDGQPTYYGNASNCGVHTSNNTLEKALTSAATITCSDFYAVGIGLPKSISIYSNDRNVCYENREHGNTITKKISGGELLNSVAAKVGATTKEAINLTSSSQLTN